MPGKGHDTLIYNFGKDILFIKIISKAKALN